MQKTCSSSLILLIFVVTAKDMQLKFDAKDMQLKFDAKDMQLNFDTAHSSGNIVFAICYGRNHDKDKNRTMVSFLTRKLPPHYEKVTLPNLG